MRDVSLKFHYPDDYSHDEIALSQEGWSYSPEDTHFGVWIREAKSIVHDVNFVAWCISKVRSDGTTSMGAIIEVGANIGTHACAYMTVCDHLICFEPFTTSFECLKRNILKQALSSPNCSVDAYCAAAGDMSGEIKFWIRDKNHGESHIQSNDRVNGGKSCVVPVMTLGDLDHQSGVRLIKIDAEGYEPQILIGATALIVLDQPEVILEVNNRLLKYHGSSQGKLFQILEKLDYELKEIWQAELRGMSLSELENQEQYDAHFGPRL